MGMYRSDHPPMLSTNCFVIIYLWLCRVNSLFRSLAAGVNKLREIGMLLFSFV